MTFSHSDALEITLERYSDSHCGNCLDTWTTISDNLFWLNNSTIYWSSKKQKSVVTSTYEPKYLALALATKQWIWLMNALESCNVPDNNAGTFCDNKATIDITYNHTIVEQCNHIDVDNYLVYEYVESGQISCL
jgi:hypothetical protein